MSTEVDTSPAATLLLLTREDAERFLERPFEAARILCLTPTAQTVMESAGRDVETHFMHFGNRGHQRGLVRCRILERHLDDAFAATGALHAGTQEALRQSLLQLTAAVSRIWCAVGARGPWVCLVNGAWYQATDRWAATSTILARIRRSFFFVLDDSVRHPHRVAPALLDFLNRCIARQIGRFDNFVIYKPQRGMTALCDEIRSLTQGALVWSVVGAKPGLRSHRTAVASLIKMLLAVTGRPLKEAVLLYLPATPQAPAVARALKECLAGIREPVLRRAVEELQVDLVAYHCYVDAMSHQLDRHLRLSRPRFALLWVMGGGPAPAIAWAAARHRVACWMLSASSVSGGQADITSRYAAGLFAKFTGASRLTHGNMAQSPAAARAAHDVAPDRPLVRTQPIVWMAGRPAERAPRPRRRERVILFLGNFACWHDDHPWVWETAAEIAHSISLLAEATAGIERCRLIIRSKSKPDFDTATMRYLVRDHPHCEVQASVDITVDNSIPSLETSIDDADLAVGFFSTSLEEALYRGCPVLLWGGRQRYQHLPARFTPPRRDDRAAVYGVWSRDDLRPMLEAILAAHEGTRLSPAEMREHCWPDDTPGISELVRFLLSGDEWPADSATVAGTTARPRTSTVHEETWPS